MTRRPLAPGWCFFGRHHDLVFWTGPVEHAGQSAPAYICEPCAEYVRQYIAQYHREWDARPAM